MSDLILSIEKLVNYNYKDEEDDFNEMNEKGEDTSSHIFHYIIALDTFIKE